MTHLWLTLDPQGPDEYGSVCRVSAQPRPFERSHFPSGARGEGWPVREVDVPDETWAGLLSSAFAPDQQDVLHRQWWDDARTDPEHPSWTETRAVWDA